MVIAIAVAVVVTLFGVAVGAYRQASSERGRRKALDRALRDINRYEKKKRELAGDLDDLTKRWLSDADAPD